MNTITKLMKKILFITLLPTAVFSSTQSNKAIILKKNETTYLSPSYFYNIKTSLENHNFPTTVNITAEDSGFKIKCQ